MTQMMTMVAGSNDNARGSPVTDQGMHVAVTMMGWRCMDNEDDEGRQN